MNVFDVAVFLLIVFVVLGIFHKNLLTVAFERDRSMHAYTVAFEVSSVRYDVVDDLAPDAVMYTVQGEERMKLGSMLDEPVIVSHTGADPQGSAIVDLTGTLLCYGLLREGALVLPNGCLLTVGKDLAVNTEVATMTIRVISITEIG